jgi:hypothetical protein
VTPPFEEEDLQSGMMPLDGDVITTRSYDEMKALRSAGAGTSDHDGPFRDKDLKTT